MHDDRYSSVITRRELKQGTESPSWLSMLREAVRGGGRDATLAPNYTTIDSDDLTPFWRGLGQCVDEHGYWFIMELSHSGR